MTDEETIEKLKEIKSLMDNQRDYGGSVRYVYDSRTDGFKKAVKGRNGWIIVSK